MVFGPLLFARDVLISSYTPQDFLQAKSWGKVELLRITIFKILVFIRFITSTKATLFIVLNGY